MYSNLLRDTIQMDKKARTSVDELIVKKENLDQVIKEEEKKLKKEMQSQIKEAVRNLENKFKEDIKQRHEQEIKKFEEALDELLKVFNREKEQWVETMYQSCIK